MFVGWAWSGWMLSVMYYWRGFGVVVGWCVGVVGDASVCLYGVWGGYGKGGMEEMEG
jgi:hypothetical protein